MNKLLLKKILIVVAIVLVVGGAVGGTVGGLYKSGKLFQTPKNTNQQKVEPTLDANQGEYVPPNVTNNSSGIAIPGWNSITLPAGKKEVAVDLPNPAANDGKYYLTFELRLKATNEVLYTSGMVSPGLHIQKITLSRALSAGTYDAVIHVQPYKMDGLTKTNNANVETKLIVV